MMDISDVSEFGRPSTFDSSNIPPELIGAPVPSDVGEGMELVCDPWNGLAMKHRRSVVDHDSHNRSCLICCLVHRRHNGSVQHEQQASEGKAGDQYHQLGASDPLELFDVAIIFRCFRIWLRTGPRHLLGIHGVLLFGWHLSLTSSAV